MKRGRKEGRWFADSIIEISPFPYLLLEREKWGGEGRMDGLVSRVEQGKKKKKKEGGEGKADEGRPIYSIQRGRGEKIFDTLCFPSPTLWEEKGLSGMRSFHRQCR